MNYVEKFMADNALEIGEEFRVDGMGDTYCFNRVFELISGATSKAVPRITAQLLTGEMKVVKFPFSPKKQDLYYYIDVELLARAPALGFNKNPICCVIHDESQSSHYRIDIGNCFRTEDEANIIYKRMAVTDSIGIFKDYFKKLKERND